MRDLLQNFVKSGKVHNKLLIDSIYQKAIMQAVAPKNLIMPSTTIIIPAYNEERRIGKVLEEFADFVNVNNLKWDVIVSIDGSDNTKEIVEDFSKDYSFVKYETGRGRSGKGYAIKRMVDKSTGEFTSSLNLTLGSHPSFSRALEKSAL